MPFKNVLLVHIGGMEWVWKSIWFVHFESCWQVQMNPTSLNVLCPWLFVRRKFCC